MPLPDNEEFNLKFVELIESFKCLYDQTLPEYKSLEDQDKAWHIIADTCSAAVQDCKFRWKHLRGGLTRYIKRLKEKSSHGEKPIKQFYLWNAMQFVVPHLRSRDSSIHITYAFDPGEEDFDFDEMESLSVKSEIEDNGSDARTGAELRDNPLVLDIPEENANGFSERGVKRRKQDHTYGALETIPVAPEKVTGDIVLDRLEVRENPDLQFFRSILPDIAHMGASKKRRFKIKVLQLLEFFSNE